MRAIGAGTVEPDLLLAGGSARPVGRHLGAELRDGAGELKTSAAILEEPAVEKILTHLGLDPQPPPEGRAREPGQDFAA
jgi:hypothetical protein